MPSTPAKASRRSHFSRKLFRFLNELAANNNKKWFEQNKQRYIDEVRDPLCAFVVDFGPRLAKISRHFTADPRPHGGSVFRIYRDTRFSRDKSPYKTMAAVQFRHEAAKDVHAPGFYLHLEPGNVFVGAGIWHPDGATVKAIREAIVEQSDEWKRILRAKSFREKLSLGGDCLKRPPRGFDPDHELIEDLKRRDFVSYAMMSEKQVCAADFMTQFTRVCKANDRFMRFLTRAVGLPW